ncbi:hypothetical protein [Paracoccus alkenifer]|uniref:hypothetical protein n=1 Tax=Paracoccus alkenifer TaxID=65735 RepID=UPI0015A6021F|nr:hypothetical protein [Paracoccus alkenifer]
MDLLSVFVPQTGQPEFATDPFSRNLRGEFDNCTAFRQQFPILFHDIAHLKGRGFAE